jgi:hypothetical protein
MNISFGGIARSKITLSSCYGGPQACGTSHNATKRRHIVKYARGSRLLKWRYTDAYSADLSGLRALKKFR